MKTAAHFLVLILVSFGLCPFGVLAEDPLPVGGLPLLPADVLSQPLKFYGGGELATLEAVDLVDQPFSRAMRVDVRQGGGTFYSTAVMFPVTGAVQKGDIVLVQVSMRSLENSDESGVSRCTVFVQGPAPEYKKYLLREIEASKEWQQFTFSLPVTDALDAGKLSLQFGFGGGLAPHRFELAGLQFLNYRDLYERDDLPTTRATYEGRSDDADWRREADQRIEKYRKGNFKIQVKDGEGKALSQVDIAVGLKKHAFHFGSVVNVGPLLWKSEDGERYREALVETFNQSGTENGLKWAPWEGLWGGHYAPENTLAALKWLKDQGFYLRGHVMVWPGEKHLPEWMVQKLSAEDPVQDNEIQQNILDHIRNIGGATAELTDEWDVVNEPYNNHLLMDKFGDEIMVDWFQAAREVLLDHPLYLNDFAILSGGGRDTLHQQHFEETLAFLVESGAPITGMGMQGHFGETPTSIPKVYEILERYHQRFPDLAIRITEFDVNTDDEMLQADYTRDLLTVAFSHPAVVGVQCWGFWAGAHWRPRAAMYSKEWVAKPNAEIWKELSQETWWTNLSGKTDAEGSMAGRGFYGDYELRVEVEGRVVMQEFRLEKGALSEQVISVRVDGEGSSSGE
ncbi:endo-1,4-beta-xylanase [Kiritimatiellota bacterium B12222]|nr:endo-1,4-beta-xylanase [Kiritimatiellota bacterium B12222]